MQTAKLRSPVENGTPGGVRVLLATDDVAVRLTLGAVLEKSGYVVDSAASSAEAMEKIENEQYALILCDLDGESGDASRNVIKMAQTQDYRPATAYLRASGGAEAADEDSDQMFIETVDVPALLTQIADLIGSRAAGRARRAARRVS